MKKLILILSMLSLLLFGAWGCPENPDKPKQSTKETVGPAESIEKKPLTLPRWPRQVWAIWLKQRRKRPKMSLRKWKPRPRVQRKKQKNENEMLTCRTYITYVSLTYNRTWCSWVGVWPAISLCAQKNPPLWRLHWAQGVRNHHSGFGLPLFPSH